MLGWERYSCMQQSQGDYFDFNVHALNQEAQWDGRLYCDDGQVVRHLIRVELGKAKSSGRLQRSNVVLNKKEIRTKIIIKQILWVHTYWSMIVHLI